MQAMPSLCAVAGVRCATRFAVDFDRAAIRLMRAGDDFDERGFARAIFAEQRVDFARLQIERHALQRAHRAEGFGDGGELEERRGHPRNGNGSPAKYAKGCKKRHPEIEGAHQSGESGDRSTLLLLREIRVSHGLIVGFRFMQIRLCRHRQRRSWLPNGCISPLVGEEISASVQRGYFDPGADR